MGPQSQHAKQNLDHLFDVEFSGRDTAGLIKAVTGFFAKQGASISAFRQQTYTDKNSGEGMMKCKFVVNMPSSENFDEIQVALFSLFETLNVTGKVVDKHKKENHEDSSSW